MPSGGRGPLGLKTVPEKLLGSYPVINVRKAEETRIDAPPKIYDNPYIPDSPRLHSFITIVVHISY